MSTDADVLALPQQLPEVEHWRDEPVSLLPAALYTLTPLVDSTELIRLQDMCESKCDTYSRGECIRPPPDGRWNFSGQKLDAVVRHHVELAKGYQFNPLHFFVAVPGAGPAAEGAVLFVTLDADDEAEGCVPDAFWVKAEDAGFCFMNMVIGNSDWYELKGKHALKD
ncbi:amino acid permease protein [Diplodia corticola]|uniref:Amino acid permease protein n=1 Tax=Diplodia corticola TaxID=236234 RepID=A0A1J9R149_9PEZI|nr:amino acid permease protein [Diplodia corticola]OJD33962.1 amino acid permease protein [Diplodia corticola]